MATSPPRRIMRPIQVHIETHERLKQAARNRNMSIADFIDHLLVRLTHVSKPHTAPAANN